MANLIGGAGNFSLPFGIPVNTPPGDYQIGVDVAVSSADYNNGTGTFTRYLQSDTGSNYWRSFYTNGVVTEGSVTAVPVTLITVTAAPAITAQSVACGMSISSATSISVVSFPSAFTATTTANGSCFFEITMPNGALNLYSLSLDSMTEDHTLKVYFILGFSSTPVCETIPAGTLSYNCPMVQSGFNTDIMYIEVKNTGGLGGNFRLVTP